MCKKIQLLLIAFLFCITSAPAQVVKGKVLNEKGEPLVYATVFVDGTNNAVSTNEDGKFRLKHLRPGEAKITVSFIGYQNKTLSVKLAKGQDATLTFNMEVSNTLDEVEVFGERYKQPEKLDAITRMPLRPSEQIQSISIISEKVIAQQGALTITDAVRNVPGVTLFGSYGGVKESMSSRGFRGIPVLKNGVRMDSQFQTASGITDMQGVESIQMIKGSAAVTQGVITDLGNAGGVINVVTKTPKFVNGGEVSVRTGSWGLLRATADYQSVLDKNRTVAFRMNGAYERSDNYRPVVSADKVYVNPSLEWRPDDKTTINLEMDYLNSNATPVTSTVNFAGQDVNALYEMPHNKFLGFDQDNVNTKLTTYSARINRKLNDLFSLRATYMGSSYKVDNTSTSLGLINKSNESPLRTRTIGRSLRNDKNSTFQLDFVGKDVYTGSVKHTFQVGFDYRTANATTQNLGEWLIDTIDVINTIPGNKTPQKLPADTPASAPVVSKYSTYGIMAQEVMTINKYAKVILGLRYSSISTTNATIGMTRDDAWDPNVGIMVSPFENVNLFGSFTTSTSLRSAANVLTDSVTKAGPSRTKQWEFGIKSDWLDNRLRFNFTYFHIRTDNLTNSEYRPNSNISTGYYYKAGDLVRDGIEVELNGRILDNLQVMLGYAYLNARYKNSPSYVDGSAPMNAPKHTANGWVQYTLDKTALKGLSLGVGVYYVGKRPVNEYSLKPDGHGNMGGTKPFDMPAYTTVNAQLGYTYNKLTARVFVNNIFNKLGYNAYFRGGYINQIAPCNLSATVSYRF